MLLIEEYGSHITILIRYSISFTYLSSSVCHLFMGRVIIEVLCISKPETITSEYAAIQPPKKLLQISEDWACQWWLVLWECHHPTQFYEPSAGGKINAISQEYATSTWKVWRGFTQGISILHSITPYLFRYFNSIYTVNIILYIFCHNDLIHLPKRTSISHNVTLTEAWSWFLHSCFKESLEPGQVWCISICESL